MKPAHPAAAGEYWVGGYTADADGRSMGVTRLQVGENGSLHLAATGDSSPSPSWIARHPSVQVLYAAREFTGEVAALHEVSGELRGHGTALLVGEALCHLLVSPGAEYLIASCWGDGRVGFVRLNPDGTPDQVILAAPSVDPHDVPGRQSRAHCALLLADGSLLTTDLGHDVVRHWRIGEAGLELIDTVVLPVGSGPRHLAQHPSGAVLVVTEYSCEVYSLLLDSVLEGDGRWAVVAAAPVSAAAEVGSDFPAEICLSPTGELAYVGIRGRNTIGVLAVSVDGRRLTTIGEAPCGGDWPRHQVHHSDPHNGSVLLVANQKSGEIAMLPIGRDGVPGAPVATVHAGSPTCLLPVTG